MWLHARRTRKHRGRKVSRKRRGNYEKYDICITSSITSTEDLQCPKCTDKNKKQSNTSSTPRSRKQIMQKKPTRKLGGSDVRKHALAEATFASAQGLRKCLRKRSVTSMRTNKGKKNQHSSVYCERSESIGVLRIVASEIHSRCSGKMFCRVMYRVTIW